MKTVPSSVIFLIRGMLPGILLGIACFRADVLVISAMVLLMVLDFFANHILAQQQQRIFQINDDLKSHVIRLQTEKELFAYQEDPPSSLEIN